MKRIIIEAMRILSWFLLLLLWLQVILYNQRDSAPCTLRHFALSSKAGLRGLILYSLSNALLNLVLVKPSF